MDARIDEARLLVDDAERLGTQAAFSRAEAWLRDTLERRPGHPTVLVSLARLELARGHVDLAALMAGEAARASARQVERLERLERASRAADALARDQNAWLAVT